MEIFQWFLTTGIKTAYGRPLTALTAKTALTGMSAQQGLLDRAASATTCNILSEGGKGLIYGGAVSLAAGGAGLVPMALGSLALLAANYGCPWNTEGDSTLPDPSTIMPGTCMETDGCMKILRAGGDGQYISNARKLISVERTGTYPNGTPKVTTTWIDCLDGEIKSDDEGDDVLPITTQLEAGSNCLDTTIPPVAPDIPDYTYNDSETGCTLVVKTLGFAQDDSGQLGPVFQIEPAPDAGLRENGGGIISGCNFAPTIYYNPQGPGGPNPPTPPIPVPDPLPDGDPWWKAPLLAALGGIVGQVIGKALNELLESPWAGITYRVVSVCEKDADGEDVSYAEERNIPIQKYQPAVLSRLDAIASLLQPLKDYKQPICKPQSNKFQFFRALRFESADYTSTGNSRCTKEFRYRGPVDVDERDLANHWKDFSWNTGPAIVKHEGSGAGNLQVWAASTQEGERVIRHAFAEIGLNPDEIGVWSYNSTENPRYGIRHEVFLKQVDGCWSATSRNGPDGWPLAATVAPAP